MARAAAAGITLEPVAEGVVPLPSGIVMAASWGTQAAIGTEAGELLLARFEATHSSLLATVRLGHRPSQIAMQEALVVASDGTNRLSVVRDAFSEARSRHEFPLARPIRSMAFLRDGAGRARLVALWEDGSLREAAMDFDAGRLDWAVRFEPEPFWVTNRTALRVLDQIQTDGSRLVLGRSRQLDASASGRVFQIVQLRLDVGGGTVLDHSEWLTNRTLSSFANKPFPLCTLATNYAYFRDGGEDGPVRAVRLNGGLLPVSPALTGPAASLGENVIGVNGSLIHLADGTVLSAPQPALITVATNLDLRTGPSFRPNVLFDRVATNPEGGLFWTEANIAEDTPRHVGFLKWQPRQASPRFHARLGGRFGEVLAADARHLVLGNTGSTLDRDPRLWDVLRFRIEPAGGVRFLGNQHLPDPGKDPVYPAPASWSACEFLGAKRDGVVTLGDDGFLRWLGWSPFGALDTDCRLDISDASVRRFDRVPGGWREYRLVDTGTLFAAREAATYSDETVPPEIRRVSREVRRSGVAYLADGARYSSIGGSYYSFDVFLRRLATHGAEFLVARRDDCHEDGRRLIGPYLVTPTGEYPPCGRPAMVRGMRVERLVESGLRTTRIADFGAALSLLNGRGHVVTVRPAEAGLPPVVLSRLDTSFGPDDEGTPLEICGRGLGLGTTEDWPEETYGLDRTARVNIPDVGPVEVRFADDRSVVVRRISRGLLPDAEIVRFTGLQPGISPFAIAASAEGPGVQLFGSHGATGGLRALVVQRVDLTDLAFPSAGPVHPVGEYLPRLLFSSRILVSTARGMTWVSVNDRVFRLAWPVDPVAVPVETLAMALPGIPTATALLDDDWFAAFGTDLRGYRRVGGGLAEAFRDAPSASGVIRLRECPPRLVAFDELGGVRLLEAVDGAWRSSRLLRDDRYVDAAVGDGQVVLFGRSGIVNVIEPAGPWLRFPDCQGLVPSAREIAVNLIGTPGLDVVVQSSRDLVTWRDVGSARLNESGRGSLTVSRGESPVFFRARH